MPIFATSVRPHSSEPFWNRNQQTIPDAELQKRATDAIRREWERVWELPLGFYHTRFAKRGLSAKEVPPLSEIPPTTKADLRTDEVSNPPFGTHRVVGLRDAVRIGGSTGTSGVPVIMMFGPNDVEAAIEFQCRVLWRYGVRPGDSFTHSWPQGFYISSTSTSLWYLRAGILEIPVGPPMDANIAADHIRLWDRLKPNGYQMTSSQLAIYDDAAKTQGVNLAELLTGRTIGLLDAIFQFEGPRKRIESLYGFRIRNMGGVGDIPGFGLTDCEYHTGLHVPSDYSLIEVIDPISSKPIPEGQRGHLVVTTFGLDSVFLRYNTEDICSMTTSPCPCGETGARFTFYGRAIDGIEIGDVVVLPIDVQAVLDDVGAPEFQMLPNDQQTGRSVRIRIETDVGKRYAEILSQRFGVPVEVSEVEVGSLPRSTFKPRRVAT